MNILVDARAASTLSRSRKIKTVLLATDLSPTSDDATAQAIELAASLAARFLVINVIDHDRLAGGISRAADSAAIRVDQQRASRERPLLDVVERARVRGLDATFLVWTGQPGPGIVAAAEAEKADLVVVGTRGLGRAGRFLLGSVSDYVVYHSSCAVLVAH
jgi:nucleotide-binding universal stress UspA family protein